jgi:seryl-tRNA synthetase
MQSIELIRENPDRLIDDYKRRNNEELIELVKELQEKDQEWRDLKHRGDQLRHKRNEKSEKINELQKQGKDFDHVIDEVRDVKDELEDVEAKHKALKEEIDSALMQLPNLMHESVPYGESDEDNEEVKRWGEPSIPDHDLKPHNELAEELDVANFKRSAKISGHGFYFLKGDLALMNQALIRFAIDQLVRKGFEYHEPPLMMRRDAYETGVSLDDFEDVMYEVEDEDEHLIGTSEHPMLARYKDETIEDEELPIKHCAYSMCFRKEVGSHGIDTKGLFRTHQFNKVEQVAVCKPENSWEVHEAFQANAEQLHKQLELPYRVVNCCTGDLGSFASKKYDIETWMPRQETYQETTSASNFTDYQARRANISMHRQATNEYEHPHTLNATAVATSRIMVAILENYQNKDGTVTIPKVLRPYMYGKERIE